MGCGGDGVKRMECAVVERPLTERKYPDYEGFFFL